MSVVSRASLEYRPALFEDGAEREARVAETVASIKELLLEADDASSCAKAPRIRQRNRDSYAAKAAEFSRQADKLIREWQGLNPDDPDDQLKAVSLRVRLREEALQERRDREVVNAKLGRAAYPCSPEEVTANLDRMQLAAGEGVKKPYGDLD